MKLFKKTPSRLSIEAQGNLLFLALKNELPDFSNAKFVEKFPALQNLNHTPVPWPQAIHPDDANFVLENSVRYQWGEGDFPFSKSAYNHCINIAYNVGLSVNELEELKKKVSNETLKLRKMMRVADMKAIHEATLTIEKT